jgi:HD-like signal output (HDOD) protein
MKKRILFVDDDQHLLDGLRRSLRPQRKEWEMTFVSSGEEALKAIKLKPYDAIITDMRMAGMDGRQLLDVVSSTHPEMVRFILSGQSDDALTLQSVMTAHQYLSKPCDSAILVDALQRTFALQEIVANEKLRTLIAGLGALPTLPSVYTEINQKVSDPNASLREIGEIIAKDPAMTAKTLQLVNSAFFGLGRKITNPADAATLLGIDTLKTLVLSIGIFSQFEEIKPFAPGFTLESLWEHSLGTANLAMHIARAESEDKTLQEESLLAGLLHRLGIVVLAFNFPDEYREVVESAGQRQCHLESAENEQFGVTHSEVGAYLLGLWGFSDTVVEAVAFLHHPERAPTQGVTPLILVHVANAMVSSEWKENRGCALNLDYLQQLGLTEKLEVWRALHDELADEEKPT